MGLGLTWTYETDRTRKTFLESPESGGGSTTLKIRAPFVPAKPTPVSYSSFIHLSSKA